MRPLALYIATSLDMYIARKDGAIDWLFTEGDYGYDTFIARVDTTLMGYKTYEHVRSFGEPFPYIGMQNIVFSRQERPTYEHVSIVGEDPVSYIRKLKEEEGKAIWLVGGGQIVQLCLEARLIDEFYLFIHPIMLGEGIPLSFPQPVQNNLEWLETKSYENGMVQLHYRLIRKS